MWKGQGEGVMKVAGNTKREGVGGRGRDVMKEARLRASACCLVRNFKCGVGGSTASSAL